MPRSPSPTGHARHLRRRRRPRAPQAAARALQPARRRPAAAALRRRRRRPQGDDRRRRTATFAKDGVDAVLAAAARRRSVAGRSPQSLFFVNASIDDEHGASRRSARGSTPSSTSAACRATASTTWPCRRRCSCRRSSSWRAPGSSARPIARPFARLIVEKPIGHDLASARAINDAIADGVRRAADLPDRSLPRQGDGPEHPGAAVRQQHLRAAVQPEVHRPRADHGGRGGRRRHARRLLRAGGRAARHGAEPHAAAARAGRDGAAATRSTPTSSATRSSRCSSRCGRSRARRSTRTSCARSTRPASTLGAPVPGYRERAGRRRRSRATETFVALQVFVDNWRWAGVPFFLRTGKRLPKRASEIAVQLKEVPPILFNADPAGAARSERAVDPHPARRGLRARHQLEGARAAACASIRSRWTSTTAARSATASPEAYERLLLDVMAGDATLFMRRDAVEAAWRWVMPILERWAEQTRRRCRPIRPATGDRPRPTG